MSITDKFEERLIVGEVAGDGYSSCDVDALLTHARACEAMLKKHQWSATVPSAQRFCCPCCRQLAYNHSPDCALGKLIEGVE